MYVVAHLRHARLLVLRDQQWPLRHLRLCQRAAHRWHRASGTWSAHCQPHRTPGPQACHANPCRQDKLWPHCKDINLATTLARLRALAKQIFLMLAEKTSQKWL